MNIANKSLNTSLAVAGLVVVCGAPSGLAGYKSSLTPAGVGQVQSSLAFSGTTKEAITSDNLNQPSAGVTGLGSWTVQVPQPTGTPLICTSTVSTVRITGGFKAVARSWVVTGVTADNAELTQKLADEHFVLTPNLCGAGYSVISGDEMIDGQRYLVVHGNATGGTAAWFRGYCYNGTLGTRDDIVQNGTKIYDAVVMGPFDFSDTPARSTAFKVPIPDCAGGNLYMLSDGIALSATDLQFVNPPVSVGLGCSAQGYPPLSTRGGCGSVSVTYDPPFNQLPPGASFVTATATDSVQNYTTVKFQVVRTFLRFSGFDSPIGGISGTGSTGSPCTPIRTSKAGSTIPIKFDTTLCGTPCHSGAPPTVTIRQIDPNTCAIIGAPIDSQYLQWVSDQWHVNWKTQGSDSKKTFRVEVNLGDGSPNPYAIIYLK